MISKIKYNLKQLLTPKAKLVVINYHQLGERFDPKIHNAYIWNSVELFEAHMDYLRNNYTIVSLKDGLDALRQDTIKETLVCITFDDGDASITSLAMPLLERLEIPATFFINTAYGVEKMGYWYNLGPYFEDEALLEAAETIRTTDDPKVYHSLLQLEHDCNEKHAGMASPFYTNYKAFEGCTNPLFYFGLHGHEHLRFSMLSREEQKQNLLKNIEEMKDWPNYVPYFAIPFGTPKDWNRDTLEISEELNVIPLLAYHGYNTSYNIPLLRFSVDTKQLDIVFKNFSPSQKTYNRLNNLKY